jgi:hypothetical protein
MEIIPSHITISDFCDQLQAGTIEVNRRYQRSDRVWPDAAQSFLIETILRGFPVPKLFLHQKTDRVSRKSIRQIIDGQQRATAIKAFYDDELRLARNLELEEARFRTYSELDENLQARFLNFPLAVDLFANTSDDDVREVFRRINSYEVPLNPEEQRHARYQGEFKWFIYHLSSQYDELMFRVGAFTDKQLVRMQDMKLLTEITHSLLNGISTTNKRSLDTLYREYDPSFPGAEGLTARISAAFDELASMTGVHDSPLVKPYSLYALVLALLHAVKAAPALSEIAPGGERLAAGRISERRLSVLIEAIEERDEDGPYGDFVKATLGGTNVKAKRETRFKYLVDALSREGGRLISA